MKSALKPVLKSILAEFSVRLCARLPLTCLIRLTRRFNDIQLSPRELSLIIDAVKGKAPCNFLVFGVGNDSRLWARINRGGKTVFIEDNRAWYRKVIAPDQNLKAYLVNYNTSINEWQTLLDSPPLLEMIWPDEVREERWDVILVDAPAGWNDESPGRMKSIFHAPRLAANSCDLFIHDCDRPIEKTYCERFLKREQMRAEIELLRHYRIDNHHDRTPHQRACE
ncbi:MAG TPA: hypothetical protein VJT09_03710 [Pyrinomonadaceae bacterium]|nr:hypothetical protein [Pyrinomonadaceae bacterium]